MSRSTVRQLLRLAPALLLTLAAGVAPAGGPPIAAAHPLGHFTVHRHSRIEPAGDGVRIVYVLDLAEIPTFQERPNVDADRDGQLGEAERERYADRSGEELRGRLKLTLDGAPAELRLVSRSLSFPPGQAELPTLRLEAVYAATLPGGTRGPVELVYRDDNNPTRIGWREVVARAGAADTRVERATVPTDDLSDALRSYPDDLLNSPLNVREARLTFVPGMIPSESPAAADGPIAAHGRDIYASLTAAEDLSLPSVLFLLGLAMVLGAGHALSPGHGKTVVAAYLVGSRGTAKHALLLGATVTATHTAGVYALGLVTLYLSQYVLPERLYPILRVVSGRLVVGIGGWLLARRLRRALHPAARSGRGQAHVPEDGYEHDHGHGGDRRHDHELAHADGRAADRGHSHDPHHAHGHDHPDPGDRAQVHAHAHGGLAHAHLPPGADGQPVTWRSLLALGISGGLLPCPSALVVLLSAIALHRVPFGLLLVVAFSIGLASVLVGLGLLLIYARRLLQRLSFAAGPSTRLLPVASAVVIVVAGLVITVQALPGTF